MTDQTPPQPVRLRAIITADDFLCVFDTRNEDAYEVLLSAAAIAEHGPVPSEVTVEVEPIGATVDDAAHPHAVDRAAEDVARALATVGALRTTALARGAEDRSIATGLGNVDDALFSALRLLAPSEHRALLRSAEQADLGDVVDSEVVTDG